MAQREHVYGTSVAWQGGVRGVCSAEGRPDLPVGPPAEFGGPGDAWSPEELAVAWVNSCVMLTFLRCASRAAVELIRYRSEAQGVLAAGARGLAFTSFTVRPVVTVATGHLAGAREAMDRSRECLVSSLLAAEVRIEADVAEAAV